MIFPGLRLTVLARGTGDDLAGGNVDREIDWIGKGRALLDEVIRQKAERLALNVDGVLLVERAITKAEGEAQGNAFSVNNLGVFPVGDGCALLVAENEKTALRSLLKADLDGFRRDRVCEGDEDQG